MTESEKHSIRNNTIATVIGGLILSGIGYVVFFVPSIVRWVAAFFVKIWNYSTSSSAIPRWLLWVLSLLALVTIIRSVLPLLKRRPVESGSNEPNLGMYTEDRLFGVIWRWSSLNNFLDTVRGYCPDCDTMLVYSERHPRYQHPKTSFYCESCDKTVAELEGDKDYAKSMIGRQVERKIRNGEWKQVIRATSNNSFNPTPR